MRRGFGGGMGQGANYDTRFGQDNFGSEPRDESGFYGARGFGEGGGSYGSNMERNGSQWQRENNYERQNHQDYGDNYGQGFYGRNENEGWENNDGNNDADDNPNIKGSYGSSNYGNMPSRRQGGTDYNSTSRYYSRTRDNDPFV